VSVVHKSPTGWHPLAGWQMRICVGPYGAQSRLQHAPPQGGSPASRDCMAPLAQIAPSARLQFDDCEGGVLHVP
jgi:hypothetical protein